MTANSIDDFKDLWNDKTNFKMLFCDIGVGWDVEIESLDIAEIYIENNQLEIVNHDGLVFITNEKNIKEITELK